MRADPALECSADHGLGSRPHDQRLLELRIRIRLQHPVDGLQTMVGHHGHFPCETLDVLGLLLDEAERYEQREIAVFMTRIAKAAIEQLLHALPDPISPRPHDHAAAHAGLLGEVGLAHDRLIPFGEIVCAGDGQCVLSSHDGRHDSGDGTRREGVRRLPAQVACATPGDVSTGGSRSPSMKASSAARASMASR